MRLHRELLREEAEERNARTPMERTRQFRVITTGKVLASLLNPAGIGPEHEH